MNKVNVAMFFVALLTVGALAAPRKVLDSSDTELTDAQEHQRILAELEVVAALRERMLQEAESYTSGAPEAPAPMTA
ncbi:hypothetical protein ABBQ32_003204 [Trebouxia sp. C0010 RCD-2024]